MRYKTVCPPRYACIFLGTLSACFSLSSSFQPAGTLLWNPAGRKGIRGSSAPNGFLGIGEQQHAPWLRESRPMAVAGVAGRMPVYRMAAALSPEGEAGWRGQSTNVASRAKEEHLNILLGKRIGPVSSQAYPCSRRSR